MTITLTRRACSLLGGLALLAGCSAAGTQVAPATGELGPAARAGSGALLYVVDDGTGKVPYYSYPKMKQAGVLSGFGSANGACVDAGGNVFISDAHNSEVDEFAHGGTKVLRRLKDAEDYLGGCAIDPVSGNLAVATQPRNSSPGGVAIFAHAKGKPKNLDASGIYYPSNCAYDDKGDLFVDGGNYRGGYFKLSELPARSKTFVPISLNETILVPGGLQWDGKYLAVADPGQGYSGSVIYRFAIDGSTGTNVSTVELDGSGDVMGFWIDGARVIVPDKGKSGAYVKVWKYPGGGNVLKSYSGFSDPVAATISQ
ncbi:MAG TPA: hypothetical protein VGI19_04085 [Candidatus Cybelea sp.]